MAGNADTLPITVDQMIYHARSVARDCQHAFVVCDMPFGSYQISKEEALRNACRMMKETGVDALKLEGGVEICETVKALVNAGIPVHGHLGLTPQSVNKFGGYGIRAKEEAEAQKLISDAIALDEAGCFAIVLEKVPAKLAAEVSKKVKAVTIGIGAGTAGRHGRGHHLPERGQRLHRVRGVGRRCRHRCVRRGGRAPRR